jgi:outer membrane protein TolC
MGAKVGVTYPLNDTNQKTNERNARFQVKQAEIQVDKYKRVVRDDVTSKVEHLDTYFSSTGKRKERRASRRSTTASLWRTSGGGRFHRLGGEKRP